MYKMGTFALFTTKAWKKDDVEVTEYGNEIWINQRHLEKNLILQILLTELSIILQNLKKCEIQECGKYQPGRIFIKNTLAVEQRVL